TKEPGAVEHRGLLPFRRQLRDGAVEDEYSKRRRGGCLAQNHRDERVQQVDSPHEVAQRNHVGHGRKAGEDEESLRDHAAGSKRSSSEAVRGRKARAHRDRRGARGRENARHELLPERRLGDPDLGEMIQRYGPSPRWRTAAVVGQHSKRRERRPQQGKQKREEGYGHERASKLQSATFVLDNRT